MPRERRSSITQLPARRRSLVFQVVLWSGLSLGVLGVAWVYPREVLRPLPEGAREPVYRAVTSSFVHRLDDASHPLVGAAAIDIDGDAAFEVFVGGGEGQDDALLAYEDGALVDRINGTGLSSDAATYGATSVDIDGDGDVDLFVARRDGVALYLNDGAGHFDQEALPLELPDDAIPLSVTVADFDGDADGDVYISVSIAASAYDSASYNEPEHIRHNVLLQNQLEGGDLRFADITSEVTQGLQNTFTAAAVDLDEDHDLDLVLANDTGPVEILQNNGEGEFTRVDLASGYGHFMGLAVGDVDNDGDPDLFLTNVGNSMPDFLVTGDLNESQTFRSASLMLRNTTERGGGDAPITFESMEEEAGITIQGFGRGAVFEDVNFDGRLDLLYAQNHYHWPIHALKKLPGKILINYPSPDGPWPYFFSVGTAPNPFFGVAPLIVDLDGDAQHDLLWVNVDGPLRAFLNMTDAAFLAVRLPDGVLSQGARVVVETASGRILGSQTVTNAMGAGTDRAPTLNFGMGENGPIARLVVIWADGSETAVEDPEYNTWIDVSPAAANPDASDESPEPAENPAEPDVEPEVGGDSASPANHATNGDELPADTAAEPPADDE